MCVYNGSPKYPSEEEEKIKILSIVKSTTYYIKTNSTHWGTYRIDENGSLERNMEGSWESWDDEELEKLMQEYIRRGHMIKQGKDFLRVIWVIFLILVASVVLTELLIHFPDIVK
jgi:hypothetical protein